MIVSVYRQSQVSLNAAGTVKQKTESNDIKKQKTKSTDVAKLTEADKAKTGRVSQSYKEYTLLVIQHRI